MIFLPSENFANNVLLTAVLCSFEKYMLRTEFTLKATRHILSAICANALTPRASNIGKDEKHIARRVVSAPWRRFGIEKAPCQ